MLGEQPPQRRPIERAIGQRVGGAGPAAALAGEGIITRLGSGSETTGAALCFANPVNHDLLDPFGLKLAGAGQRRTRHGLLHQGSVALPCDEAVSLKRAARIASSVREWIRSATASATLPPETATLLWPPT